MNNNNNNIHTGDADEGGALEVDEGHAVDARHPLDRQLVLVQPDLMLLSHFLSASLYYCLTFCRCLCIIVSLSVSVSIACQCLYSFLGPYINSGSSSLSSRTCFIQ